MVFNLELSDDYLSAATIRGMAINRLNTVHTYIVLHTYIHTDIHTYSTYIRTCTHICTYIRTYVHIYHIYLYRYPGVYFL